MKKLTILIVVALIFWSTIVHTQVQTPEVRYGEKLTNHSLLQQKANHSRLTSIPEYPGNCDPFPIPTSPVGPTIVRDLIDHDDEYQLTVWRYPCDEDFSWVIFTVDPIGQSEPFICDPIIVAQDATIAEDYTLTQDPVVEDGIFCERLTKRRSFAVTIWGFAETFIDLEGEFNVAWDLFGGDEQITVFAYDPEEYGIDGTPRLDNQVAVNGLFYVPSKSGHGIDLNVISGGVVIYYYGHTSNGERLWLISNLHGSPIQFGEPVQLEMFEVIEGTFFDPTSSPTIWGTMILTFDDCDNGTADFKGADGTNSMAFVRLAGLEGEDCQQLISANQSQAD